MRLTGRLISSFLLVHISLSPPVAAQRPRALLSGAAPQESRIAGGETQTYSITLQEQDFLRVRVNQGDIDLGLSLRAPDGTIVAEASNSGAYDAEFISIVAKRPGEYTVDVKPGAGNAPIGSYTIAVVAVRPATAIDVRHAEADVMFSDANRTRRDGTAPRLREASALWASARDRYAEAGDDWRTAESWNRIGMVGLNLNEYGQALAAFQATLPYLDRIGDRRWQGVILNNIGLTQWNLALVPQALDSYERSLAIRREVGDKAGEASTLFNMALAWNALGEAGRAIALYEQTLPLRRAVRDGIGEARSLTSMATALRDSGYFQPALENYQLARPMWQAVRDRGGEADALRGLSRCYLLLGDLDRAQAAVDEAMAITRPLGDQRALAIQQQTAGDIAKARGDLRGALDRYLEVVAVFEAIPVPQNQAIAHLRVAEALLALGDLEGARARQAKSLALARERGSQIDAGIALELGGRIDIATRRYDEARSELEEALRIGLASGDRLAQVKARSLLAVVHRDSGRLHQSLDEVTSAIGLFESTRATLSNADLRTTYRARTQKDFELQIDVLMRLHGQEPAAGHDVAGLIANERSRARVLLESLGGNLALIRGDANPALIAERDRLRQQVNALEYRRVRAIAAPNGPIAAPTAAELTAAMGQYRDADGRLRASSPHYAALLAPPDVNADALRRLVGDDTVLIEYALGAERSYAWTVNAAGVSSFVLAGRESIEKAARQLYIATTARNAVVADASVEARRARLAAADKDVAAAARDVSALVLAPAAAQLTAKRIVVVADGALNLVPFALLPQAAGATPLAAAHDIAVLPSAAVLAEIRKPRTAASGAAVAVLADPVFDANDPRVRNPGGDVTTTQGAESVELSRAAADVGLSRFNRLRFSRDEANAIAALVPKAQGFTALDFSATRDVAISADVARARVVHFATHGVMNTSQPELSGLVFSLVDDRGKPRDGFMRLHDIYNLRLDAELVVLSACRTAAGREVNGEGVMALTRGFLAAGAPRVIATLWDVDDRATAELMTRFYTGLLVRRESPAAALRAAQMAMAKTPQWSASYFWAGFTLVGDWR